MVFAVFALGVLVFGVLTVRIGVQSIAYDLFPVLPHVLWVKNACQNLALSIFAIKKSSDFFGGTISLP